MPSALYEIPFGILRIEYTENGLTGFTWTRPDAQKQPDPAVHQPSALTDEAFRQFREYLSGKRRTFDLPLCPKGTAFQQAVWKALMDIPYGETRTYGQIAAALGRPGASRAVGSANHHNPLWVLIPCHRVIGAGGSLTGYAGGLDCKKALLRLEGCSLKEA